jgi:hypothetical protein
MTTMLIILAIAAAQVLDAIQRWADDELRSLNAQIEYVLRDALRQQGRLKNPDDPPKTTP